MLGDHLFNRFFHSSRAEAVNRGETVPCFKTESSLFKARFWAIGGGKGGVGKSFVASNMGVLLSRLGKKVLVVDADLGAANLHTFFGTDGARHPLSGFLKGDVRRIEDVISKTAVPNLDIISGAKDTLDVADLKSERITRLRDGLKGVEYDYILLDTGPGTSSNLFDLFLMGDEGIIVTTPEPTSIENTYRFLKCLVIRRIKKVLDTQEDGKLKELLKGAFNEREVGRTRTIKETFEHLKLLNQREVRELMAARDNIRVSVIINQARRPEDKDLGPFIKRGCYDYFGFEVNYLGHVGYEECVFDSIRDRRPLTIHQSNSAPVKEMERCLHGLITKRQLKTDNRI